MFETAFTLNLTQFARGMSLPERLQKNLFRNMSLELLRQRNTALDAFFYDIKNITAEEAFYISDSLCAEGSIMIVPPTGRGQLVLCDAIEEFLIRGGRDVHVLAVAGVGGTALGAAAFARNVADAVGKPVAAVVSGYGLADVMSEPLGSSFLFGWLNNLRHPLELLDEFSGQPDFGAARSADAVSAFASRDTRTTLELLENPKLTFELVVGHSKGNSIIAEAFETLADEDPARLKQLSKTAKVVTFGARIAMPKPLKDVIDVMGNWDWFGEINSRSDIACDRPVPDCGHHTNSEIPGYLPVTRLLIDILAQKPEVPDAKEAKAATDTRADILKMPEPPAPVAEETKADLPQEPAAEVAPPEPANVETSGQESEPTTTTPAPHETGVSPPPESSQPPEIRDAADETHAPIAAEAQRTEKRDPAPKAPVAKPRSKPKVELGMAKKPMATKAPVQSPSSAHEPVSDKPEDGKPPTTH